MLKEVNSDYYYFIEKYLCAKGLLSCDVDEDRHTRTYLLNGKEVLESSHIRNPYPFPSKYCFYVDEDYLTDFFITMFEEEGKSDLIKTYFVCYYDNDTKQLGNDIVKIYQGIKDKDSLNRMISKLKNKVILNYKEI